MADLYVKHLEIRNFKGIADLSLDFAQGINIFIGVNGMGKSSVLQALSMVLSRFIGRLKSLKSNGISYHEELIKNGENESSIEIVMSYGGKDIAWRIGKERYQTGQTITNLKEIRSAVVESHEALINNPEYSVPMVVFYGVGRTALEVPKRIKTKHQFGQLEAYDGALLNERSTNDFRLFFEWFRELEDCENETLRRLNESASGRPVKESEFQDRGLKAVRAAISQMLPGFSELRIRRKHQEMILSKKLQDGTVEELSIQQLSEGEKCTLSMIGDLARRLSIANPSLSNPLLGEGIVMIDEIDLHLHPQWERDILPDLQKIFPNCQFIVTTHSPLVLSSMEPENIFILSHDKEKGIIAKHPLLAKGLSIKDILSGLMNDVGSRDAETELMLKNIEMALFNEDISKAKRNLSELKHYLRGRMIPEIQGLEADIAMLEAEVDCP